MNGNKENILDLITEFSDRGSKILMEARPNDLNHMGSSKWSAAEEFSHICQANSAIAKGLATNKFMLKMLGTPNRPVRAFKEVVDRYEKKLSDAATDTNPYPPKTEAEIDRTRLKKEWQVSCANLLDELRKWTEEDLDSFLLPHPLMGRMIVREMMFFSIHHTSRHLATIEKKLSAI